MWTIAKAKKRIYAGIIDFVFFILGLATLIYLYWDTPLFIEIRNYFSQVDFKFNNFTKFLITISNVDSFLFFALFMAFYLLFYLVLPLLTDGRTLGRMIFGIRIVKLNETRMSFGTLLLRQVIVNLFFTWFSFEITRIFDLIMLFHGKGRRIIADRISNTLVMERGLKIK